MNSALILITKKVLKKLAKMPSEDEMAREVAKRELMFAVEKKKKNAKAKVFNQKQTVKKRRFTLKKAVMMK